MEYLSPRDARTGGAFYSGVHPGREPNYPSKQTNPSISAPKVPLADFMRLALGFMGGPIGKMMYGASAKAGASAGSPKAPGASQEFNPRNFGVGPLGVALNTPRYQKAKAAHAASMKGQLCIGGT